MQMYQECILIRFVVRERLGKRVRIWIRSECGAGINSRDSLGCQAVVPCLGKQKQSVPGLCLKDVSGFEGTANLLMMVRPICVVTVPVKTIIVNGSIILDQFLFHKVASIKLGIAKSIAREMRKVSIREGSK